MFTFALLPSNRSLTPAWATRRLRPLPHWLAIALLAFAGTASAQIGLGLAPMREELNLAPGAAHSSVLTLANTGGDKVRIMAEVLDFYLDSTATPQFGRAYPREAEFSCKQWLTANPMEMELNGKSQIPVRYTVRVPAAATARSYHCAIGFTTQPTPDDLKRNPIGLRTAVQIVAAIYVVVGQPALDARIQDLRMEYAGGDPSSAGWRAVVTFHNAGLMHFRPTGDLEIMDAHGAVLETVHLVPLPVLPKRDQSFVLPLKLTGVTGPYTLRARVDLGGDEIQEATAFVDPSALVAAAKPHP